MRSSLVLLVALLVSPAQAADPVRFFESRVRPLLVERCHNCHGPKKQQGGLRLDSASGFRTGGDTGPLIDSARPGNSLLLRAVRHEGPKMPPRKPLSADEVAILTTWVKQGAPWPAETNAIRLKAEITAQDRAFWSFRPVRDPPAPVLGDGSLARTGVDSFLLARLQTRGLSYSARADRRTLLRRLHFDLIGLPPSPDEVEAFVGDNRPDAYERLVERLLASPGYGERWGRHWLDVVRYADTAGDNSDYPVPQLHRYRNWVLTAFNEDRPFNQFIEEQVAGDLLPARNDEERNDRLIATGYLASARRFGSYEDKRYQWYLTFEDTIENLGRSFLGLSLSCARCHDHKFDPIPSEDYYALYGFFQSTRYPWPGIELDKRQRDLVPLATAPPDSETRARLKELATIEARIRKLESARKEGAKSTSDDLSALRTTRDRLARSTPSPQMAYAVFEGQRWVGNARMQLRGDPAKPGKEVPRRFLQILGGQPLPPGVEGSGRLHLAGWLSDANNPLTARVLVNRLWLHHFGRGIVPTPNDFGRQGQPPSHPELLDWLASRFVESGWSIKTMHRLIVLSAAYQQASADQPPGLRVDPDNVLLWRHTRRRLDAEALRDTLLSLGGQLDRSVGGPHPFPPQTTWNFTQHKPFKAVYESDRRSVYLMTQRIQRHPYLALFDGADTNASTARRDASTTPLQALYLMNDPLVHRLARGFAHRLGGEATDGKRVDRSFVLAFGRPPTAGERTIAMRFLTRVRARLDESGTSPEERERQAWESYARALFLSNELVYVD